MTKVLHEVRERVQLLVDIRQGLPGAQGKPGAPGGSGLQHPAGTTLGGHRIVLVREDGLLDYASNDEQMHADRVIGITLGGVSEGEQASVTRFGPVEEPSWNWDIEQPVFLGTNGLLTQTPPVAPAAFLMRVGMPMSPTSLFVNIGNPIFLTA